VAEGLAQAEAPSADGIPRRRLYGAYAAIVLVLVGLGVAAFILLRPVHHKPFSAWTPAAKQPLVPQAIARHVAHEYTAGGRPLLTIRDAPFAFANLPVSGVGIGDQKTGRTAVVDRMVPRTGAMYFLCGRPPSCAVNGGHVSEKDVAAIEAEGLETALRTLHALPSMKGVLVLLPANQNKVPTLGMYIRPAWQRRLLDQPLSKTLGWETPPPAGQLSRDDVKRISALTVPYTFKLNWDQLPDGSVGLTLIPLQQ